MIRRLKALGFLLALLGQVVIAPASFALTGFEVVSGDVTLHQSGNVYNITSNSAQAVVQWQSFNVNAGQTVNFLLPTNTSSLLNRVLGGNVSNIFGNINSNGTVLLSNTAGINIGASANINTGGFIASTLNLSNTNYLNDNWVFTRPDGVSPAGIINEGNISTNTGGFVVLAGGAVMNTGNIFAPEGTVHLAVGDEIRVALGDNTVVDVTVNQALMEQVNTYQSAIQNLGVIDARRILLQADLLESFYAETINNTGILRATTASSLGKSIRVYAFSEDQQALLKNGGIIDVSGTELAFDGGTLELVGDKVLQSGVITADAYDGGTGGSVLISSTEKTLLASGSVTSASGGIGTGNAGKMIIWSDKTTMFENGATIDVSGGDISGDGGFVEVSGYETVYFQGQAYGGSVDGKAGSILIDPLNIVIDNAGVDAVTGGDSGGTPDEAFAEDAGLTMTFDPQAGGSFNGFGDIHLQATNDITVNSAFDTSLATGNPNVSLTLEANNNITINAPLTTNNATITLLADADSSGVGTFTNNNTITSNSGDITIQGAQIDVNAFITTADVNAGIVTLTTTAGSNGNITYNNSILGNEIYLTADGSGTISWGFGTLGAGGAGQTGIISMTSGSGDIGTVASPLEVDVWGELLLNTTGSAYVHEGSSASLDTSNVGGDLNVSADNGLIVINPITSGGNITLLGDADNSGAGFLRNNSTISSTGGNIILQGNNNISNSPAVQPGNLNSNGGDITITGTNTGAFAGSINQVSGIVMQPGNVISGGGDITMTGSSAEQEGIRIVAGAQVLSGGGNITLNGTSNAGPLILNGHKRAINFESAGTLVDSGGGAMSLTASGVSGTIIHYSNSQIRTQGGHFTAIAPNSVQFSSDLKTGGGNIDITLTDPTATLFFNYNTGTTYERTDIGTGGGNMTLHTDRITIAGVGNPGPTIDLGSTGTLTFAPTTPTNDIGLGGGAGTLNLLASELDLIQNGTLTLGDSSHTGDINLGTVDLSGQTLSLALQTQGNVVDANGAANNITVASGNGITINAGGNVGSIADPIELNTPLLNLYPSTLTPVFDGVASQINYIGAGNSDNFELGYYEGLINAGLNPNGELLGHAILNSELLNFYNSSAGQGTTDFILKPYITPGLVDRSGPIFSPPPTASKPPSPTLQNLVNHPTVPVNSQGIRKAKRLIQKNGKLQLSAGS